MPPVIIVVIVGVLNNINMSTEKYIGSALKFPIQGHDEIGMKVTIDWEKLKYAIERFETIPPCDMVINILPLKPENVTDKKTHSVKLMKVIPT